MILARRYFCSGQSSYGRNLGSTSYRRKSDSRGIDMYRIDSIRRVLDPTAKYNRSSSTKPRRASRLLTLLDRKPTGATGVPRREETRNLFRALNAGPETTTDSAFHFHVLRNTSEIFPYSRACTANRREIGATSAQNATNTFRSFWLVDGAAA